MKKLARYPDPETLAAYWEELAAPLLAELTPVEQVDLQMLIFEMASDRYQQMEYARQQRVLTIALHLEARRKAA